ncbi:hypothetical protein [Pseudobutyrivibrio ruminis]|uniref:hypothetical protein n=1 Tax=Pseudobutyrivibrio ruminis TaxID=46206 RepID=UPI0004857FF9|nr:hypothetical protein [Pseudobutyrivibrio ruminis]
MRKRNYKGRCTKKTLPKCQDVCRTYDALQEVYAEVLSQSEDIKEFRCNVYLEGLKEGDYTSDFVCTKQDGSIMVRECVYRSRLTKPMNYKLLEASREYWRHRGVLDWGIIINAEK